EISTMICLLIDIDRPFPADDTRKLHDQFLQANGITHPAFPYGLAHHAWFPNVQYRATRIKDLVELGAQDILIHAWDKAEHQIRQSNLLIDLTGRKRRVEVDTVVGTTILGRLLI